MIDLNKYSHVYLLGIAGIGMSALARYFNFKDKLVFGYDRKKSDLSIELESEGISIHYNDNISKIPRKIINSKKEDTLIIYTPAINKNNKEYVYFKKEGFQLYKRAQVLAKISEDFYTIAIAGTHGKTTTSTILTHLLKSSGVDLTSFIGGVSNNYNSNLIYSESANILVVEADEYDHSFLNFSPDIAVITSLDSDHLDIYETEEKLKESFIEFSNKIKSGGYLIVEDSIKNYFSVPKDGHKYTYSAYKKADFHAMNIEIINGRTLFDLFSYKKENNEKITKQSYNLILPGKHNVSNSISAIVVCEILGLNEINILKGIQSFAGVKRRYDIQINNGNVSYIDDYAHHPNEIYSTIYATRDLFPNRNLTVVFQPHLYSRTRFFINEFAESLSLADHLILLDIYAAREKPIKNFNSTVLLDLCTNNFKKVCKKSELIDLLSTKDIDVLLTLGAGDISDLVKPIKYMLN